MASAQLQLIDTDRPWKLDRHTVEVGRAGVARARAALAAATAIKTDTKVDPPSVDAPEVGVLVPHRAAA
jgi:hypothetical protein